MASTLFKGNPVHTNGNLPAVGSKAPAFTLVGADLSEKSLSDFSGQTVVLTINPSYDTGVCQATARRFNTELSKKAGVAVLMISADLPFAQKRFCSAEGIEGIIPLSTFRSTFAKDYGLELVDGPLKGVTARAVIVVDPSGQVKYSQLVDEITTEPSYDSVLAVVG
jgi:thioredoxin-dependent peroxiredoxin